MVQILEVEIFMLNMLCIVLLLSNVDQKGIKVLLCWFYEMLFPVLIPLIILEDIKYNKEKKFSSLVFCSFCLVDHLDDVNLEKLDKISPTSETIEHEKVSETETAGFLL